MHLPVHVRIHVHARVCEPRGENALRPDRGANTSLPQQ